MKKQATLVSRGLDSSRKDGLARDGSNLSHLKEIEVDEFLPFKGALVSANAGIEDILEKVN